MKNKNKTKLINCVSCTNYCKNQDKNKLVGMVKEMVGLGYKEIVFCCEALNGSLKEVALEISTRLGFKNAKGKIKWI